MKTLTFGSLKVEVPDDQVQWVTEELQMIGNRIRSNIRWQEKEAARNAKL